MRDFFFFSLVIINSLLLSLDFQFFFSYFLLFKLTLSLFFLFSGLFRGTNLISAHFFCRRFRILYFWCHRLLWLRIHEFWSHLLRLCLDYDSMSLRDSLILNLVHNQRSLIICFVRNCSSDIDHLSIWSCRSFLSFCSLLSVNWIWNLRT